MKISWTRENPEANTKKGCCLVINWKGMVFLVFLVDFEFKQEETIKWKKYGKWVPWVIHRFQRESKSHE